ncbi:MAG TPA: cytidylate kinase-like family protein [Candidatus Omnitrophota bacterium]|nr:cytidylate kinase-like family protein [Candidatus Omnitrophota bacterium]
MSEIQKLKSFVDSLLYYEHEPSQVNSKKRNFPFITISRLAGAGGQSLAKILYEKIQKLNQEPLFCGWQLCNQEICHIVAQDPALKSSVESLLKTEYHSHAEDFIGQLVFGVSSQDVVIKKMFHMMRAFAIYGKVVFVGRGSALLTHDLPLGIHIRLVASLDSRIKRMMQALQISEKEARQAIAEKDKAKAELVKTFFSKDIHDPLLYDAIWNTDRVSMDEIAGVLVEMIRKKAETKY